MQQVQQSSYVQYAEFVTVCVGLFTLTVVGFWTVIYLIGKVKDRLIVTEEQNKTDVRGIDDLWDAVKENRVKMESIEKQRGEDIRLFTDSIGKLNITLGKIEVTMENNNKVIDELKQKIK